VGIPREHVHDVGDLTATFGEPCNTCALWSNGAWCEPRHRQKDVIVETGPHDRFTVRRRGGCPDHKLIDGPWWHIDPVRPFQSGYGGSSINILL
jgi:hypothetical protein